MFVRIVPANPVKKLRNTVLTKILLPQKAWYRQMMCRSSRKICALMIIGFLKLTLKNNILMMKMVKNYHFERGTFMDEKIDKMIV